MPRVRWQAILLVASLLIVPAAARAAQALDPGRHATTTSFSKSDDVPEPVVIARDSSCTSIDIDALLHPIARSVAAFDYRLPTSPDALDFDFLRGPPDPIA